MASPRKAKIVAQAMSVDDKPGQRSTSSVSSYNSYVKIACTASDLGALRATLNSTLREAKIANDAILD